MSSSIAARPAAFTDAIRCRKPTILRPLWRSRQRDAKGVLSLAKRGAYLRCMEKNLGHDEVDRGVEGGYERVYIDGEWVTRKIPPATDGLGNPAAPEHAGSD